VSRSNPSQSPAITNSYFGDEIDVLIYVRQSPQGASGVYSGGFWSAKDSDIPDGMANTINALEYRPECGAAYISSNWWDDTFDITTLAPINFPTCPGEKGNSPDGTGNGRDNCRSMSASVTSTGAKSMHSSGVYALVCDGAVRFLSDRMDYDLFQRLGGRKEGMVAAFP
jgi:hypothetical protein